MSPLICKLKVGKNNDLIFEAPVNSKSTLEDQIVEDKQYGTMKPRNGEFFTYKVVNWEGKLMTSKQLRKAVTLTWEEIERHINIDIRWERNTDNETDFKVFFRKTADDPQLDENTLQYHYFPISDINHPLRGVCVVNTDFPITIDGEPVDLHLIDEVNYPNPTKRTGVTFDFDQIYDHEGPGHGLGLPHSKFSKKKMSSSYQHMVEHYEDEDPQETIPRLQAKYGKRNMLSRTRKRWTAWKRKRYDNY